MENMRLKIVQAGEPVLRAQARQLTREEIISDEIQRLIRDMRETMRDAPGVGLAAPQVGMALQLAVIEDREELLSSLPAQELAEKERQAVPFHVIINPEITLLGDDRADFYEGCLSLAGFSAVVRRARRVRVAYLNEHGEPHVHFARQLESFLERQAGPGRRLSLIQSVRTYPVNHVTRSLNAKSNNSSNRLLRFRASSDFNCCRASVPYLHLLT